MGPGVALAPRGAVLARSHRMTSEALLELSIRLMKDLTDWSQEATRRDAITPAHLSILQNAAEIIDTVTVAAVDTQTKPVE